MTSCFQLTNEFAREGPLALSELLCVSRMTTVWGVVSPFVEQANQVNGLMDTRLFLDLLRMPNGPLRYTARANWFDKRYRNRYAADFEHARWNVDFDGPILSLLKEDERRPPELRRVYISPEERGWEKAEEALATDNTSLREALSFLCKNPSELPASVAERVNRFKEERDPFETILRDVFNHDDAMRESSAEAIYLSGKWLSLVTRLGNAGLPVFGTEVKSRSRAQLSTNDALDALGLIRPLVDRKNFVAFFEQKNRNDREILLRLFEHDHGKTTTEELRTRVSHLVQDLDIPLVQELFPELFSEKQFDRVWGLGMIAQLAYWLVNPHFYFGLMRIPARAFQRFLRKADHISAGTKSSETDRALFQLVFGTRKPKEGDIRKLLEALRNQLVIES